MLLYSLKFAWWNVSLSPASNKAKPKGTSEIYADISGHIEHLLGDHLCDIVALCEVSEFDVNQFELFFSGSDYSVKNFSFKAGLTRFDTAVVYNHTRVEVDYLDPISRLVTGNIVKAGQILNVTEKINNKSFKLILCHWASRLRSDGVDKRNASATLVSDQVSKYILDDKDVIIMGDFNDNPYDESLLKHLRASRCHEMVRKYPNESLYNPFWRTLVSEERYTHLNAERKNFRSGTHKFKQVCGTYWHSYDQIIFSGSLLGKSDWHLNEKNTGIIDTDRFASLLYSRDSIIDHLPVVCELTKP